MCLCVAWIHINEHVPPVWFVLSSPQSWNKPPTTTESVVSGIKSDPGGWNAPSMGSEMKSHISIKELTKTGFNVHSTLHNMYNGGKKNQTPTTYWSNFRINDRWTRKEFLPVIAAFHPQSQLQYSSQWSLKRGVPSHYSASPGHRQPENNQPRPQIRSVNVNPHAAWEYDYLTCSMWWSWTIFFPPLNFVSIYDSVSKYFWNFGPWIISTLNRDEYAK